MPHSCWQRLGCWSIFRKEAGRFMKLDEESLWKGRLLFKLKTHFTRCLRLTAVGSSSLVWRVEWWPLKRYTHILISRIDGQIDGKQWKQWETIFLGSKITADGDCSHEIKRRLLLGRKAMTNLLKSRDITLPAKVCLVKVMVFPVVMYECESWTIKKDECQRIDAFELWCGPGTARQTEIK